MKAIIFEKYGDPRKVLRLKEIDKPEPKEDEVLVNVRATSATTHNLIGITGKPFFVRLMNGALFSPAVQIPGSDIAGRVEAVGENAGNFKPGNEVYGDSSMHGFGASGGTYVSVGAPSLKGVFQDMVSGPRKYRKAGKKIEGGWAAEPNKGLRRRALPGQSDYYCGQP